MFYLIGHCFPLNEFEASVINHFGVSSSQLYPVIWVYVIVF